MSDLISRQMDSPKAKWKRHIVDSGYNANWKCSNCGYVLYLETPLEICPKCKADMWGRSKE